MGGMTTLLGCRIDIVSDRAVRLRAALTTVKTWRVDPDGRLILAGPDHVVIFGPGTRTRPASADSAR
jgi:hypothetical protein